MENCPLKSRLLHEVHVNKVDLMTVDSLQIYIVSPPLSSIAEAPTFENDQKVMSKWMIILCVCWQVEKELKSICGDILDALDRHLLPSAAMGESKVFYNKM